MAAQTFVKEVLRPGVYVKGGRKIVVTQQDCRDYFNSLSDLDQNGLDVPLVYEHTEPGKENGEGTPDYNFEKAENLKRTVGLVDYKNPKNRLNAYGGVELALKVHDENAAQQLADGRIKFVSPELRPYWQDGLGRQYRKLFTHIALTHRPIVVDQRPGFQQLSDGCEDLGAASAPIQLSISELEVPVAKQVFRGPGAKLLKGRLVEFLDQLADDDEDEDKKKKPEPPSAPDAKGAAKELVDDAAGKATEAGSGTEPPAPPVPEAKPEDENPDMPKAPEDRKMLEALLAHLAKDGYSLPADTTGDNLVERLLTAAMTKNAVKDQAEADADKGGGDKQIPAEEQAPNSIAQLSDAEASPKRDALVSRIRSLRERGILQPGVADKLMPRVATIQFSDAGEELPAKATTLSAVLDAFEGGASLVHSLLEDKSSGYQLSDPKAPRGKEIEHPRGDKFFKGPESSDRIEVGTPEAQEAADDILRRHKLKK